MGSPTPPAKPAPGKPDELQPYMLAVASGDVVYKQGDASGDVYFVQRGRVELAVESPVPSVIGVVGIGDFFGEAALLDDDPRTHRAKALGACTLLKIDRATFHQLLEHRPEIASRMLWALIGRERERPTVEPLAIEALPQAPAAPHVAEPARAPATPAAATPAAPAPAAPSASGKASLLHASRTRFELSPSAVLTVGRPDRASGKAPEIDLSPFDTGQTLSRQHALVGCRDGVYFVKEEKATRNGTFVNGQRVATGVETALKPGDTVRFGLVEVVFQVQ